MRHAGAAALDRLDGLLQQMRRRHRGGQGWLHFHEDPAGLFADLKIAGEWTRFAVDTAAERKALLERLAETLAPMATA